MSESGQKALHIKYDGGNWCERCRTGVAAVGDCGQVIVGGVQIGRNYFSLFPRPQYVRGRIQTAAQRFAQLSLEAQLEGPSQMAAVSPLRQIANVEGYVLQEGQFVSAASPILMFRGHF
ncbi:hypothetical protein CVS28_16995 [Arthrobacter glacialis]|nr:hypothetical protein CVS28_16995 [Arthrobacter glacialis]